MCDGVRERVDQKERETMCEYKAYMKSKFEMYV